MSNRAIEILKEIYSADALHCNYSRASQLREEIRDLLGEYCEIEYESSDIRLEDEELGKTTKTENCISLGIFHWWILKKKGAGGWKYYMCNRCDKEIRSQKKHIPNKFNGTTFMGSKK